jgi:transposase-like protein
MVERTWKCQRSSGGTKCAHTNPKRKQICEACGKRRPATKKPSHAVALDLPYEAFIILNGGEYCGICGAPRSGRKLDRDHAWVGPIKGKPRGLLCHSCNRTLSRRMEIAAAEMGLANWLRAAADYIERAEARGGMNLEALL